MHDPRYSSITPSIIPWPDFYLATHITVSNSELEAKQHKSDCNVCGLHLFGKLIIKYTTIFCIVKSCERFHSLVVGTILTNAWHYNLPICTKVQQIDWGAMINHCCMLRDVLIWTGCVPIIVMMHITRGDCNWMKCPSATWCCESKTLSFNEYLWVHFIG